MSHWPLTSYRVRPSRNLIHELPLIACSAHISWNYLWLVGYARLTYACITVDRLDQPRISCRHSLPRRTTSCLWVIDACTTLGCRARHAWSESYRNIASWFIILHPQSAVKRTSGTHGGDTAGSMDSPELEVEGWGANLSTESSVTHIRPLMSIGADPADMRYSRTLWSLRLNPPCLLESRNVRQTSTARAFLKTRRHYSSTWTETEYPEFVFCSCVVCIPVCWHAKRQVSRGAAPCSA